MKNTENVTSTFRHMTREFAGWSKTKQADHLREVHGVDEATIAAGMKVQGSAQPAMVSLYQVHVTAHTEGV